VLILLPPSEGKAAPRRGTSLRPEQLSFPELRAPRSEVLAALVGLCASDDPAALEKASGVLGVGKTLGAEVARNAGLATAPAARADRIYTGVLYEALDLASLEGPARRRATARVATVSALFGLVRPHDHIPAYRLSGDVSLPGLGNVATFWGRHLDPAVAAASGRGLVVDLRSSTYTPFWRPDPETAPRVVTVRVLHEVGGRRKVVSHFNKATKGRIVRAMLLDGGTPRTPEEFADHLRDLGWTVEPGRTGKHGTGVDVVVSDL
jgi:cytoplasmic iron level regulating protein YaaA (DUF328/UPF0246 family)